MKIRPPDTLELSQLCSTDLLFLLSKIISHTLQSKLRHIKNVKSLSEQRLTQIQQCQMEVVTRVPEAGTRKKMCTGSREKQTTRKLFD